METYTFVKNLSLSQKVLYLCMTILIPPRIIITNKKRKATSNLLPIAMNKYTYHYKSLTYLGIPIVVGQIGTIILGFADTLMIGHHSTPELAAAAFVNNMFTLVFIFAMGFAYGLTPIVGSLYGQDKSEKIGEVLKNSLMTNTLLAVALSLIMGILYLNLNNLGQPEELLPLMKPYFIVNLISVPFVVWFNTFKQISDGITDTQLPMWILLGGNLLNIAGNYLLIYGHFGFPELGLLGAGISSMGSRIIMTVVFLLFFLFSKRYKIYLEGFRKGVINRHDFLHLNRLGWPLGMQMGMETASFNLSTVMVGWIGTTALAAHQIMLSLSQIFFMVYYGMAAAVAVRVSYYMGQKEYKQIETVSAAGFHIILLVAFIVSIPVFILKGQIGMWFTDSQEVSLLVAQVIIPLILYQFGDGMQCAYANALRGISEVKPLMYMAFIAYFVVSLPVGYLLGIVLDMGLLGIWYAFPLGLTTAGVLYYWTFKQRMRETNG